jgi:hypothetical protein
MCRFCRREWASFPLPVSDKGWDAFQGEDLECRAMAAGNLGLDGRAGDALIADLGARRLGVAEEPRRAMPWARLTPQQRYDAVYLGCHRTYAKG